VDTYEVCGVALNQPAFQSSVYSGDGFEHGPGLGNDGRHSGVACVMTDNETNPWWAVRLRQELQVTEVKFTNVDNFGKS